METVSKFFKEEKDFLYRKGEMKGRDQGRKEKEYEVVANLIIEYGFSDEQVAAFAKVSASSVNRVREELNK